ncbi:copper resistance protein CopC [Streptomyces minutiscleroticus]|uniref:copper resistance CopC/CopD family protein n=1 Tax=Streptomyces minutiscleroticus TaxID=68238 RepID=UPI003D9EC6CC
MRVVRAVLLLGAALGLLLLGGAGPAAAHSSLRATDPREDTVLRTAPRHVTLTFTEAVGLAADSLRVLDPENRRVNVTDAAHAGGSDTVRVRLRDDLPEGTFTVAWRVVSADSHPISGAFTFSVGEPSATTAAATAVPAEDTASRALLDIGRYTAYTALALLVGTVVFALVCRPPAVALLRGLLRTGWWALLAATLWLLLWRGPYERGSGPGAVLEPSLLRHTLTTRPGQALLARLALLVLAAAVTAALVRARRRAGTPTSSGERAGTPAPSGKRAGTPAPSGESAGRPEISGERAGVQALLGGAVGVPTAVVVTGGVAFTLALALTWAVAEHAAAGTQVPAAMASAVLHLLAMAVWLGGLAALLTLLHRSDGPLPAATVARFSRLALGSVAVLLATGVYQSWRGLGSWDALSGTAYGRTLAAKTVVVLLLLTAAAYSRRWTARATAAHGPAETAPEGNAAPRTETAARTEAEAATQVREQEAVGAGTRTARAVHTARATGAAVAAPVPEDEAPGTHASAPKASEADVPSDASSPASQPVSNASDTPPEPSAPLPEPSAPLPEPSAPPSAPWRRALRRSILAEVLVGILVLVITTVLTGTRPGRAEAGERAGTAAAAAADRPMASMTLIPFDLGTPGGHGKVQILLEPGRVGDNRVEAVVYGPDGGISTVPELRLTFTLAARKIGPIDARLADRGGYWGTEAVGLPLAGTWRMKVTVRTTEVDQVTVSRTVRIAP